MTSTIGQLFVAVPAAIAAGGAPASSHRETPFISRCGIGRPRVERRRRFALVALALSCAAYLPCAHAGPYRPSSDSTVLAELPAGTRYADVSARRSAQTRVDVAIPLAQFYIQQSRLRGDLRYLGYAQAVLAPWVQQEPPAPDVLVLQATLLQSRHEFSASLALLERALTARPDNPQALLIQATVLRVLGRYREAGAACDRFSRIVEPRLGAICIQSLRGLNGHLESSYAALTQISSQGWPTPEKSWLYSELGEMAVRLGRDDQAQRWFQQDLNLAPEDFYVRAAYADLLLRQGRPSEVLTLLQGRESFEPLLLRIAIAQRQLRDSRLAQSSARLKAAFAAEEQRGEAVHRREQARFLLEVEDQPTLGLAAALENWAVQREPEDVLVLVNAAKAAGNPAAAQPALEFVRTAAQSDVRVNPVAPVSVASQ
jgi:tetratricopeptide (TPR) repeat protein